MLGLDLEYDPLDGDSAAFRLIRLFPASYGQDLHCELLHALLSAEDCPAYEALSYTWGTVDRPARISINGYSVIVTRNLYDALQYLRHPQETRMLWIDAVCINQEDLVERGKQVERMGDIYQHAAQVVVWLGLATPGTDDLFNYMNEQHVRFYRVQDDLTEPRRLKLCEELESLLRRPWFTRVWILQEMAFATAALVVCGAKTISSDTFALTPRRLACNTSLQSQAVLDIMPGGARNMSWWNQDRSLHTLVTKFSECNATDQRDMIFALLNMSSDACRGSLLVSDYTIDLRSVILETVSFLLSSRSARDTAIHLYGYLDWDWIDFAAYKQSLGGAVLLRAVKQGDLEGIGVILDTGEETPDWDHLNDQTTLRQAQGVQYRYVLKIRVAELETKYDCETFVLTARQEGKEVPRLLLKPKPGTSSITKARPRIIRDEHSLGTRSNLSSLAYRGHTASAITDTGKRSISKLSLTNSVKYRDACVCNLWDPSDQSMSQMLVACSMKTKLDLTSHAGPGQDMRTFSEDRAVELLQSLLVTGQFYFDAATSQEMGTGESTSEIEFTFNCDALESEASLLSCAAAYGYPDIVRLLIAHDERLVSSQLLTLAVEGGNLEVIKLLLDSGKPCLEDCAWKTAIEHGDKSLIELLRNSGGASVDKYNDRSWTALIGAASNGDLDVVELLLAADTIAINFQDRGGMTALDWAIVHGHVEVVKKLLSASAVKVNGQTLLNAARDGRKSMVGLLLATRRFDVNIRSIRGRTPLMLAALNGHEHVVYLLLSTENIDINARDNDLKTALILAVQRGHLSIIQSLLASEFIDTDAQDVDGSNALSYAEDMGNNLIVDIIKSTDATTHKAQTAFTKHHRQRQKMGR